MFFGLELGESPGGSSGEVTGGWVNKMVVYAMSFHMGFHLGFHIGVPAVVRFAGPPPLSPRAYIIHFIIE